MELCGLVDIKSTGCFYTWSNKQDGDKSVCCKLDRMLGYDEWLSLFPNGNAHFLTEGLFDHTPAIFIS